METTMDRRERKLHLSLLFESMDEQRCTLYAEPLLQRHHFSYKPWLILQTMLENSKVQPGTIRPNQGGNPRKEGC